MSKKFLTGLALANLTSDPISGVEGELYYNTVEDVVKIYSNGSWTKIVNEQNIITTASAAAYASASTYVNDQINALTTSDIEEGSNLYYTNVRSLNTASTALVHNNHTNLTSSYVDNQIRFSATGGMSFSSGSAIPSASASLGTLYYRTSVDGTKIIQMYAYLNGEWRAFTGVEFWSDIVGLTWANIVPA